MSIAKLLAITPHRSILYTFGNTMKLEPYSGFLNYKCKLLLFLGLIAILAYGVTHSVKRPDMQSKC